LNHIAEQFNCKTMKETKKQNKKQNYQKQKHTILSISLFQK
jgi:hypothetical protein